MGISQQESSIASAAAYAPPGAHGHISDRKPTCRYESAPAASARFPDRRLTGQCPTWRLYAQVDGFRVADDTTRSQHPLPCRLRCCKYLLTRALRSEEHTSELQSLRHLVCRL